MTRTGRCACKFILSNLWLTSFLHCSQISNANDKDWKTHVEWLNSRFNVAYSLLMVISIGCILGLSDLAGLPNPALPFVGIPDSA
jgi:hypothetical protein